MEEASDLARENERLKAELRRERDRAADAADAARHRFERDLHDGAQQQLVALALDLRLLQARVAGTDVAPTVAALGDRLAAALADLRELARGLHPAILTERGLGPALQGLADRAPLPVLVAVEAIERPPARVEATAYYVVAEALTNVARHARASHASVDVRRRGTDLVVTVSDDGIGGADTAEGTGLLGLRDRLAAHEGTLTIESRAGAGTRLVAVIPSARGATRRPPCRD
ncbi:MAG TPA: ATP-binding protein [Solirubrobacteraceae bacterium]|jgi:signal transduction histidine kinase